MSLLLPCMDKGGWTAVSENWERVEPRRNRLLSPGMTASDVNVAVVYWRLSTRAGNSGRCRPVG